MSGGKCCVNRYRAHSVLKQISEQGCNVGVDHQAINIACWHARMSYTKNCFACTKAKDMFRTISASKHVEAPRVNITNTQVLLQTQLMLV